MKRFLGALMVAALASIGFGGVTASASTTRTNFVATYESPPGTTWTCSGTRTVNQGRGTRDREICVITGDLTGFARGEFASDPKLTGTLDGCPAPAGIGVVFGFKTCWGSDFDGALATSWTQRFADNHTTPRSFTFRLTAFYNP